MTRLFDLRVCRLRAAWIAAVLLLFLSSPGWSAEDPYPPRPISDAERAAIEAVLAFFETGPNAVLTRLASDAPLRTVAGSAALDEIAVRMGPAEGSAWQLRTPGRTFETRDDVALFTVEYASGIDDVIVLDMKEEAEGWMILEIRCGVDPRTPRGSAEEELQRLFEGGDEAALLGPVPSAWRGPLELPTPALVLAAGCLLVACGWLAHARRRRASLALLLATGLVVGGCHLLPGDDAETVVEPHIELDALTLAPLLPLRRALTGGRSSGDAAQAEQQKEIGELVKQLVGSPNPDNPLSVAARAWQAQLLVVDGNVAAATKILEALPEPDQLPLVAKLRARTAVFRGENDAVRLYEHARRLGPDHDGLAIEAANALGSLGEDDKMEDHVRSQVWMRSRDATGFYYATQIEAVLDQMDKAETLFQAGWQREPISRSELLGQPILAHVGIRSANFKLFQFSEANEPKVGPARVASRPLSLPERASARILGEHLVIELGDRRLDVYGGGDVMPAETEVESAETRAAREAASALSRFDELAASLAEGGLLRTSQRRAASALAKSLAEAEKWQELIRFTDPLSADAAGAPPEMIRLRALALMRTNQGARATNLLVGLARSDIANRRRDPVTFYYLGEMLTELGHYELALRAMERAAGLTALEFTKQRKSQIELMKELEDGKQVYESRHFRMVYPTSVGETYPRQLSWVLEAERERIQKWIPVPAGAPKVEVRLYPWRKFMAAYAQSGGLVGGLYDGVVRAPLAEYESFHPELLRVYSHEVAHALIDIATRDRAPSWFHEGLAGHIEMHQRQVNPMPDMHEAGRDLTFTLLQPVFESWSEPQLVELAYINAAWALHFIESSKGVAGIHKMLDAFRRGHDTEGAIRRVFGMSPEQFDRAFRTWAIHDAPQVWPTEMIAYHEKFDQLVRRDAVNPIDAGEAQTLLRSGGAVNDRPGTRNHTDPYGVRAREMKTWFGEYSRSVRPVKVALAKALPILQGKAEGDAQGACQGLRIELDRLLGSRTSLNAPDVEVASHLKQAYGAFGDMSQHCRSREWPKMRAKMDQAVQFLGQAKARMAPYEMAP